MRFSFTCPVCLVPVKQRTLRRHCRRLHGLDIPRGFQHHARRRVKEECRKDVVRLSPRRRETIKWVARSVKAMDISRAWVMQTFTGAAHV